MDFQRCKECKYGDKGTCMLYAGAGHDIIEICPLDTMYYNPAEVTEFQQFMIDHAPVAYAQWVSKNKPIGPGDSVIALRSGYCGNAGKLLYIYAKDGNHYLAKDKIDNHVCIDGEKWYEGVIRRDSSISEMLEEIKLLEELVGPDKYSNDVYDGFKEEVCKYCMNKPLCSCSKEAIFNCPKFENYYLI